MLARCHTVWVIGGLCPPGNTLLAGDVLNQFVVAVSDYTKGEEKPPVIELKAKSAAGAAEATVPAARYVSKSRSDGGDALTEFSKALGSRANP